jgi:hypothetical protein
MSPSTVTTVTLIHPSIHSKEWELILYPPRPSRRKNSPFSIIIIIIITIKKRIHLFHNSIVSKSVCAVFDPFFSCPHCHSTPLSLMLCVTNEADSVVT